MHEMSCGKKGDVDVYLPGSVFVGRGNADEVDGQWMGEALLEQRRRITQTVGGSARG